MIVNFVGVSGGMKLGDALGVTQAQATWIAASYAYACLIINSVFLDMSTNFRG